MVSSGKVFLIGWEKVGLCSVESLLLAGQTFCGESRSGKEQDHTKVKVSLCCFDATQRSSPVLLNICDVRLHEGILSLWAAKPNSISDFQLAGCLQRGSTSGKTENAAARQRHTILHRDSL